MERYFTTSGSRIVSISSSDKTGIKIPDELSILSDQEIMTKYRFRSGEMKPIVLSKDISDLKIAVVGVWKIPCGISTYTEYLVDEIAKRVKEYRIFSEYSDGSEEKNVVRCWKRGESLSLLAHEINRYDPDVVLIQHEYGIFPDARRWLSFLSSIKFAKIYVCFHSVYRHKDKLICEAAAPNIIVHTELAKAALLEKRVDKPIHVIPHGCLPPAKDQSKLWNIMRTDHTFMQFGFGFEYKGWENSLEACAILASKYDDVFFTGLFSESTFSLDAHDRYYEQLSKLVDELDIVENVAIIRGFQSENVLDSFFRLNQALVLPYRDNGEHQVFAVTGAARVGMRSGIKVITSKVPFFSDLVGVVPQVDTPMELAQEIEKIWFQESNQLDRQNEFLLSNSWANVAELYLQSFLR